MKAYILSVKNYEEKGEDIVFAENESKARSKVWNTGLDPDDFTSVRARRAPNFDGMESASERDMFKAKWRDGWWFDATGYPDYETASDEDFYKWFDWFYK